MSGPAERIVAVLGAGASRACGGLGLGEVLPAAFQDPKLNVTRDFPILVQFLDDVFSVSAESFEIVERLPDFGIVLSIIDMVIEQGRGIISQIGGRRTVSRKSWSLRDLLVIREILHGLLIKAVLDAYLVQFKIQEDGPISPSKVKKSYSHELLMDYLYERDPHFSLISLNYDLFVERGAMQHLKGLRDQTGDRSTATPLYHVEFEDPYAAPLIGRQIHKLHGSMDWVYCPGCGRIRLYQTSDWLARTGGSNGPAQDIAITLDDLSDQLLTPGTPISCSVCGTDMRPIIIPPTLAKNYANSHIRRIWSHAERTLRQATSLYFVGYGLAVDDLAVITMLKQNTQHIDREKIYVISPDRAAIQRYLSIFGPDITVIEMPFETWVARYCSTLDTYVSYQDYKAARAAIL